MATYDKRPGFDRELANPTIISSTNSVRVQHQNETQFGEVLSASRASLIELNSAYGLSAIRDVQTVSGTATSFLRMKEEW